MLIMLYGGIGSGKSLLLTIFATLSVKPDIYTNFSLDNHDKNKNVLDFNPNILLNEDVENCDIFVDEVYSISDSRRFSSNINLLFSYATFQSRKSNINIYVATQILRVYDVRFREMCDLLIECKPKRDKKTNDILYFKYIVYNMRQNSTKIIYLSLEKATKYFGLYNTRQIISSSKIERLKAKLNVEEDIQKELDKWTDKLIQTVKNTKMKLTKSYTEHFCYKQKSISRNKQFINSLYYSALEKLNKNQD